MQLHIYLCTLLGPWLKCAFIWANRSAFCKHGAWGEHRNRCAYFRETHLRSLFLIIRAWAKWQPQRLWKRCHLWDALASLPSTERPHIVWHLQLCWNPPCTRCSAAGLPPSGRCFRAYRKTAASPSVINGRICAAGNTTAMCAAIFALPDPTGWVLHNSPLKWLVLIFDCFASFMARSVAAWPGICARQDHPGWACFVSIHILVFRPVIQFSGLEQSRYTTLIPL